MIYGFLYMVGVCIIIEMLNKHTKKACYARCFDLLHNSTLSSIHIHFGVELLVFATPLTSAFCQKMKFFDRLNTPCASWGVLIYRFHIFANMDYHFPCSNAGLSVEALGHDCNEWIFDAENANVFLRFLRIHGMIRKRVNAIFD